MTPPDGRAPASIAYLLLFVVAVVAPLVVAARYDALRIPRSDDWSYLLSLFRLLDHGVLGFNNWVSMTLVGQLALATPVALVFPDSITAVHVATSLLGFAGLLALVQGTELAHRRGAIVLAITIAVGPLWSPLAATFMTDLPAFALQCMFLALAFRALRTPGPSVRAYAAAMAVGFVAIAIRQYEAIPVIAFVLVTFAVAIHARVRLRGLVAVTAVAAAATIGLFAWWLSLPDALSLAPSPVTSGLVANLAVRFGGFVRLTGLLLAPLVLFVDPVGLVRTAWRRGPRLTALVGAGTAVWMTASYLRVPEVPFVGNYVDLYGVLSRDVLTGGRVPVIPENAFRLLAVLGSISAVVIALALVPALVDVGHRLRDRDFVLRDPVTAVLALATIGFSTAYAFAIATELPVFDRYVLPVLPLVGLLIIRRTRGDAPVAASAPATPGVGRTPRPTRTMAATVIALVVLGVVGLAYATDSASFDGTRWQVDEAVARQGWKPTRIYGGFEWISWHQRVGPPQGDTQAERIRLRARYLAPFCVDVVINPGAARTRAAIARGVVHGLGHAPETMVAVPNGKRCRGGFTKPARPPSG